MTLVGNMGVFDIEGLSFDTNGDLFRAISRGTASVITDQVDTFTETGLALRSGQQVDADIVVTDDRVVAVGPAGSVDIPGGAEEIDVSGKTIVLTGALTPARFRTTDAIFNIGMAVAAVQVSPPGVYIAMSGQVFEAGADYRELAVHDFGEPLMATPAISEGRLILRTPDELIVLGGS